MPPLPCLCCGDMAHEGKSPRGVGSRRGGTIPTSHGAGALSQPPLVRLAAAAGLLWAHRGAVLFMLLCVLPACTVPCFAGLCGWHQASHPVGIGAIGASMIPPGTCPGCVLAPAAPAVGVPQPWGQAGAGDGPAMLVGMFAALLAFGKQGKTRGPCLGGSRRGNARSWNRPRAAGESASRGRGSPSSTTTTHASQLHPSLSALHPASI